MEEAHQFPSDKICTKCVPAWDWRAASNLPGPSTHTHTHIPLNHTEATIFVGWFLVSASSWHGWYAGAVLGTGRTERLCSRAGFESWLAGMVGPGFLRQGRKAENLWGWIERLNCWIIPFSDCQLLPSGKEQWWHDQGNKFGFCLQP